MNDLTALHRAILEQPAEDTPRLMFADALMESDDPAQRARGLWIKGAIEHAGRGFECYDHPGNYDVGFEPFPSGLSHWELVFERGFAVDWLSTQERFLRHADALLWHPKQGREPPETAQPITMVTLQDVDASLSEIEHARAWRTDVWRYWGRNILDLFLAEWPGVTFAVADGRVTRLPRPVIQYSGRDGYVHHVSAASPISLADLIAADENGHAVAVKRNHPALAHMHILGTAVRGTTS